MIAVASTGCDRKGSVDGFPSWPALFDLEGDYRLYLNYERQPAYPSAMDKAIETIERASAQHSGCKFSFDSWRWDTQEGIGVRWRRLPQFDQDQARLLAAVTARNMCRMFAQDTGASHLLFVDTDIIPPRDIIPKLLEVGRDAVCGLVYGRGVHSNCPYIFGEKRRWNQNGYELVEVEHGNIGFTMISRKLFDTTAIRYGRAIYPDGRDRQASDDPCFHLDCYKQFGEWPVVRMDVVGRHIGDLKANEVSQF